MHLDHKNLEKSFDNESPINADREPQTKTVYNGTAADLDSSNDLQSNNLGIDPNASGFSGLGSEFDEIQPGGQRNFSTNFHDYKMDNIINTPASKVVPQVPANKGQHPLMTQNTYKFTMVDKEDMLKKSKEAKNIMQQQIGSRIKQLYEQELIKAKQRVQTAEDSLSNQSFPQNQYEMSDITKENTIGGFLPSSHSHENSLANIKTFVLKDDGPQESYLLIKDFEEGNNGQKKQPTPQFKKEQQMIFAQKQQQQQMQFPKVQTNQEKLEKTLQKNQRNKFSNHFGTEGGEKSNSKVRNSSPKIDTGRKNSKSPIRSKPASIDRELGQQLIKSVFKNQQQKQQKQVQKKEITTSTTSTASLSKKSAPKKKEVSAPKKSVSPAKGSQAITAKKRYVSPYSKKAVTEAYNSQQQKPTQELTASTPIVAKKKGAPMTLADIDPTLLAQLQKQQQQEQVIFKQQFSQYLDVLKNQIALMDTQIKDTLAQRDMYKQRCEELKQQQPQQYNPEAVQNLQNEIKSKENIILSMQESLKNISAFKGQKSVQKGHYRDFSLSEPQQDFAEKQFEQFLMASQEDMMQKVYYVQNLVVKYNVNLPKIEVLKTSIPNINSDDYLEQNCQDAFIRYLAQKLEIENQNRLKTEEQSAQVIGQLGETISKLEYDSKQKRITTANSSLRQSFLANMDSNSIGARSNSGTPVRNK